MSRPDIASGFFGAWNYRNSNDSCEGVHQQKQDDVVGIAEGEEGLYIAQEQAHDCQIAPCRNRFGAETVNHPDESATNSRKEN